MAGRRRDDNGRREGWPDTPYREIVDVVTGSHVNAVPVVDDFGRVLGVVSEADLLHKVELIGQPHERRVFEGRRRKDARVKADAVSARDLMTAPAVTTYAETSIVTAAKTMDRERVKTLPVVNDLGRLVGVVSRGDLLRVHLRPDVDIRRDIVEEVFGRVRAVGDGIVTVEVHEGVVTLAGRLDRRGSVEIAARLRVSSTVAEALAVPPTILDHVGRGQVGALPVKLAAQPALTADGKPLVLYIGAEYCPFCAAQRWALVVALSRFGSFADLKAARSASDDVFPSTATLSFHGATYTSQHLAFQGVELATSVRRGAQYAPLETLTAAQEKVMRVYNAPPYIAQESAGAVPFVDFGNRFLMSGAAFSPSVLKGLTQEQVAAALSDPAGPVAQAVLGSANAMTGVLCQLTGGEPGNVSAGPAATAYGEMTNANA